MMLHRRTWILALMAFIPSARQSLALRVVATTTRRGARTSCHPVERRNCGVRCYARRTSKAPSYNDTESLNDPYDDTVNPLQLNRRKRLEYILDRDGNDCVWCRSTFGAKGTTLATTDHLIPKLKGGPSWMENEVAACKRCNKLRGHTMPVPWMDFCKEQKGWEPKEDVVKARLKELEAAIQQRGGQRKARPYLAKQLKQLGMK